MKVKAVIFDLDGTITQPFLDFDVIREQMGLDKGAGPILEAMEKMQPPQRRQAEGILYMHEQKAVQESRLNEGAKRTLQGLRDSGIAVGVLTRNRKANVLAVAAMHGLHFDVVVDRDDGPAKPDAFGVLEICRRLGVMPDETLVVGDYLFDLQSARSAGAVSVFFAGHRQAAEFAEYADFTVSRLEDILDIVSDTEPLGGQMRERR